VEDVLGEEPEEEARVANEVARVKQNDREIVVVVEPLKDLCPIERLLKDFDVVGLRGGKQSLHSCGVLVEDFRVKGLRNKELNHILRNNKNRGVKCLVLIRWVRSKGNSEERGVDAEMRQNEGEIDRPTIKKLINIMF